MKMNLKHKDIVLQCAQRYESFYLYDESSISNSIEQLKTHFPQVDFLYSMKCNSNPRVLQCVFNHGLGADAASSEEVRLAKTAGLPEHRIYYSAPGKSDEDIRKTIFSSTLIADSIGEIERIGAMAEKMGTTARIGIRINPDFSFAEAGGNPSKFGIDEDQVIKFLETGPLRFVKIAGIHVHLKSQELNAGMLSEYYKNVLKLGKRFSHICGSLDFINMGSGMGVPFAQTDTPLDISALAASIQDDMKQFCLACPNTRIFIETGRYAVCKSGIYVTKVMDRKISHGKTYLILKNTLNGFIRPSLAKLISNYTGGAEAAGAEPLFTSTNGFEVLTLKDDRKTKEKVSLAGNLCTSSDMIAEDIYLPELGRGDVVIITNAGSYGAALSPFQFSSQERPKELFLTENGDVIE